MTIEEARKKYDTEPRYRELTNWLRDRVWSGAITGEELIAAAIIATSLAGEKTRAIPQHPIKMVSSI